MSPDCKVIILPKQEVDKANKDNNKRYPQNFQVNVCQYFCLVLPHTRFISQCFHGYCYSLSVVVYVHLLLIISSPLFFSLTLSLFTSSLPTFFPNSLLTSLSSLSYHPRSLLPLTSLLATSPLSNSLCISLPLLLMVLTLILRP